MGSREEASWPARVAREPLTWFLMVGALFFALDEPAPAPGAEDRRVVVSGGRIEQLAGIFARTWLRPPTGDELQALIRSHVLEELKVRAALEQGLDRDDTVIRRRLAQKWDFLTEEDADLLTPSDEDLAAFLERRPELFRVDSTFTFEQVFLSPDRHGERAEQLASDWLAALTAGEDVAGDPSLLPPALTEAPAREVDRTFGAGFARALEGLPLDAWERVDSSFGIHLVRLEARQEGRLPRLEEVRDRVASEWASAERAAREQRREEQLLDGAEVVIEWPSIEAEGTLE